jgi:hypothetical protein
MRRDTRPFRSTRPLRLLARVQRERFLRRARPDEWREHEGCLGPAELLRLLYVAEPERMGAALVLVPTAAD